MDKLGIQPVLLLAQMVNFAVLVFVLNKFLYKPVLTFLAKRKKEIAEGLLLTEKMKEEEAKIAAKQAKALELAKKDAVLLLEKAKAQAKEEAKQIIAEAHKEAQAIVAKKKEEMENVMSAQRSELQKDVVTIAMHMVEKLLPKLISGDKQKELVMEKLGEIEKSGVKFN